jgi:predicted HTH transcriptional regulator
MDLPIIPHDLKEWDIRVIDSLTLILSIESENFDFKGHDFNKRYDELYVELCSMSNSLGGYIVLGVEECKAPNGQGQEDKIKQSISNSCYNVEPTSSVLVELVYEDDRSNFFSGNTNSKHRSQIKWADT